MKKIIAGISALALAGTMAVTAFADTEIKPDPDNTPNPKPASAGTDVSYSVDPAYTVTIPEKVVLKDTTTVSTFITAKDVLIPANSNITVSVNKDSKFEVKNADDTLTYTINEGETEIKPGDTVAKFVSTGKGTEEEPIKQEQQMTFSAVNGTPKYSGKYTGTLTFDIAVKESVTYDTFKIGDYTIKYNENDTWEQAAAKNDGLITFDGDDVKIDGKLLWMESGFVNKGWVIEPVNTGYYLLNNLSHDDI